MARALKQRGRSYRVNGWIITRDPLISNGVYLFAAFGHGFFKGFDKLRDAKAYCATHPPDPQPMKRPRT